MAATGQFDIQMNPTEGYLTSSDKNTFSRMTFEKTFSGDLQGTSSGEMLSVRTNETGSAGYVALEQVTAEIEGKHGHFALQHFGIMDKGKDRLILEVVPDSGTDELVGITGTMEIKIQDGIHSYHFNYNLN